MTRKISALFSIALIFGASGAAFAGTHTPRINHREAYQQHRIAQGINSHELSAKEVARLEKQQLEIRKLEAHAKSDGHVTYWERVRIHHELNQANRSIRRQKHD